MPWRGAEGQVIWAGVGVESQGPPAEAESVSVREAALCIVCFPFFGSALSTL